MSAIDSNKKSKKRKLGNNIEECNKKSKTRSKGSVVIEEEQTDHLDKEISPKLCSEDEDLDPTNHKENLNGELISNELYVA